MKRNLTNQFKKGAASFYMVAFSTLILIIIVTSFAAIIISEVTRTANDDLSQSAYDSALAGVEDAKLLIYNYQKCVNDDNNSTWCEEIKSYIERPTDEEENQSTNDCDRVGELLGRTKSEKEKGFLIQESNTGNNMSQAYTCVKVNLPGNMLFTLNSSNQAKVIKTKFEDGVAQRVQKVRISWFSDKKITQGEQLNFSNYATDTSRVVFPEKDIATPPTISISMIQTAEEFTLDDFTGTIGDTTDRGTLFLVPTQKEDFASGEHSTYQSSIYDSNNNINSINQAGFLKSNDKTAKNLPYAVYCPPNGTSGYTCSALIDIPQPINGSRNPETFVFVVTLPYGGPDTDFAIDYMCGDDDVCNSETIGNEDATPEEKQRAKLKGVQIEIDSTGRANDMYRRVEVRLEGESDYPLSILGPLELLDNESGDPSSFEKNLSPTSEHNF